MLWLSQFKKSGKTCNTYDQTSSVTSVTETKLATSGTTLGDYKSCYGVQNFAHGGNSI